MYQLSGLILYFVTYSFGGWLYEFIYNLLVRRQFHWRGYLILPLLPIYGFSSVGIVILVAPFIHNPFFVFVASASLVTVIEYFTSWILQRIFHIRLWDYSNWVLNLKGRVSFFSSAGFGILGLLLVYAVHPSIRTLLLSVDKPVVYLVAIISLIAVLVDYVNSTISLIRLRVEFDRVVDSIDEIQAKLNQKIDEFRLNNKKSMARLTLLHRHNLQQLKRAFPDIKIFKR